MPSLKPQLPAVPVPEPHGRDELARVGRKVARLALAAAWGARNPWEKFAQSAVPDATVRTWYTSLDGWECPIHRLPALPGRSGEPVVLLHGAMLAHRAFHLHEGSNIAGRLQRAGYDVWMPGHRGDSEAIAPAGHSRVDFDEVLASDLPAIMDRVRDVTGAPRALFIGHGMGGQLLWAWLTSGGQNHVAAGIALGAPALFAPPATSARLAGQVARLLPEHWALPVSSVARALTPTGADGRLEALGHQLDGPARRSAMLHASTDLRAGFVRQAAQWLRSGRLVDRGDRRDYLAALHGIDVPMVAVGSESDPTCPAPAARAPIVELAPGAGHWWNLGKGWSHADMLFGARAGDELHPRLCAWLETHRDRCWSARPWSSPGTAGRNPPDGPA